MKKKLYRSFVAPVFVGEARLDVEVLFKTPIPEIPMIAFRSLPDGGFCAGKPYAEEASNGPEPGTTAWAAQRVHARVPGDNLQLPPVPSRSLVSEAVAHLGAALSQSLPSDDHIIIEHMRIAKAFLETALKG